MQIVVKNPQYQHRDRYRFAVSEFFTYAGESVALKHVGADSIALSTGIADFPVRVIPRAWIVTIDGAAYTHASSQSQTKKVKGSKGEEYTVTLGAKPSCTCTGFQFRKTCKHIL